MGVYTHNREFGLDAAREARLEFSPCVLSQPISADVRVAVHHDIEVRQSLQR
jgi:hypothetical protein